MSLKGAGKGALIDDGAHVVRLKNPDWQFERAEDYGMKYSVGCASTETMHAMLDCRKTPSAYWAQPKYGRWNTQMEAGFRERAAQKPGSPQLTIPAEAFNGWNARYKAEGGMTVRNFSLGTAAIIFALELLHVKLVLLAGFDNLLDPSKLEYHKAQRGKWVSGHEWQAENAMLGAVEAHYGARIMPI